jgi:hypothetical protein
MSEETMQILQQRPTLEDHAMLYLRARGYDLRYPEQWLHFEAREFVKLLVGFAEANRQHDERRLKAMEVETEKLLNLKIATTVMQTPAASSAEGSDKP